MKERDFTMMIDKKQTTFRTLSINKAELVLMLKSIKAVQQEGQSDNDLYGLFVCLVYISRKLAEGCLIDALIWHSVLEPVKESEESEDISIVHEVKRLVFTSHTVLSGGFTDYETTMTVDIESTKETTEVLNP